MSALNRAVFERYLTVDEEKALFRVLDRTAGALAKRDAAWMRLMRHTGIRVTPISRLTVHDAKSALKAGRLVIRPEINKKGRKHEVYLNKSAQKALRDLLAVRSEMEFAPRPDLPLIMSTHGDGMTVRQFQKRVRHWCRLAGLERAVSPHWFRHTLAKRIMGQSTARDPRGIVQAALGHVSLSSTAVYTLPDREDVQSALDEVS
jgi:site-specific recombinase XerC